MDNQDEGVEVWTDESGKTVTIYPFFSKLYVDEEMARLSRVFQIWKCDGELRESTLVKAEPEGFVARLLVFLVRASAGKSLMLAGVRESELKAFARRTGEMWCLMELKSRGFLRLKRVKGDFVVFPTEKLLKNQRIPKLPGFESA